MQAFRFGAVGRRFSSASRLPICAVAVCSALVAFSGCEQLDSTLVKLGLKKSSAEAGPDVRSAEPKIPQIGVYTVKTEAVPLTLELPGRTAAFNVAEVRPQVSGLVKERKFEEGSAVEKDQQLYQIDEDIYVQNLAKAEAQVVLWTKQEERVRKLVEGNATSQQNVDTTDSSLANAKADLELAKLNVKYCRVEAPISGRVGFSKVTEGALVTTGQGVAMTTIQQIDKIYVDLKPSVASALATLHPQDGETLCPYFQGAKVEIELEDGTRYPLTGTVERVDNSVEASVGTVAVRAVFDNPNWKDLNGALLPGMFVRAFVTYGERPNGILIPQQGLFRNAKGEPYVWVVDAANKTTQRPIVSERTLGGAAVVDSGLQAGDRIVVEGVQFISQDAEVAPTEASVPVIRDFEQAASAAVAPVQAEAPAAEAAPVQAEAPAQAE
ncbi:MAG: efflux RND transporter periplasmic adaptor subunit [Thermoguttaceae bacterium]|nr:efflux RND transporter periplasmic adaptor subunit [Thermoguttaceae bacterium]